MSSHFTRREFIGGSLGTAALGLAAPQWAMAGNQAPKILVVIEMAGGNDGLNTVVPFKDEAYYRARPHIAISTQKLLPVTEELALHPALRELAELYEEGHLAIINGVGYQDSSRSHFEAMDVWHSGEVNAARQPQSGWLGRYLNTTGDDNVGVVIGNRLPLALTSSNQLVSLMSASQSNESLPILQALYQNHSFVEPAEFIFTDVQAPHTVHYPQTELAQNLQTIARLIAGDSKARVFYLRLSGFDTHQNQTAVHTNLLSTLSGALAAFQQDLKEQGRGQDVLTLTVSEFGRSVPENSMCGTDHGAANCLFAIGEGVRGGVHGAYPALNDLDNGALKPNVDFRRVYATILENWLGADSKEVLNGHFKKLHFV